MFKSSWPSQERLYVYVHECVSCCCFVIVGGGLGNLRKRNNMKLVGVCGRGKTMIKIYCGKYSGELLSEVVEAI